MTSLVSWSDQFLPGDFSICCWRDRGWLDSLNRRFPMVSGSVDCHSGRGQSTETTSTESATNFAHFPSLPIRSLRKTTTEDRTRRDGSRSMYMDISSCPPPALRLFLDVRASQRIEIGTDENATSLLLSLLMLRTNHSLDSNTVESTCSTHPRISMDAETKCNESINWEKAVSFVAVIHNSHWHQAWGLRRWRIYSSRQKSSIPSFRCLLIFLPKMIKLVV